MKSRVHLLDLDYAALSDGEIEVIWRSPDDTKREVDAAVLRQLVLRALPVIEAMTLDEGARLAFTAGDAERAVDEVAVRLYVRLRRDRTVRNVRALAHQIALEVVRDPLRRREPVATLFVLARPRLRLVGRERGNER
jgi:DNA-directed RNA polymerase specialized sigma24 family protein